MDGYGSMRDGYNAEELAAAAVLDYVRGHADPGHVGGAAGVEKARWDRLRVGQRCSPLARTDAVAAAGGDEAAELRRLDGLFAGGAA